MYNKGLFKTCMKAKEKKNTKTKTYNLRKHSWSNRICDYIVQEHTTVLKRITYVASIKTYSDKIMRLYEKVISMYENDAKLREEMKIIRIDASKSIEEVEEIIKKSLNH